MNIKEILNDEISSFERHPFIEKAHKQELSYEQTIRWIMCAGRESELFPKIIEIMIEWIENDTAKTILEANLNDEYGNGNPNEAHFQHYLQLLDTINVSRDSFSDYKENAGINFAISLANNIAYSKDEGLVLGYMLINEALTPIIYSAIRDSMKRYFPELGSEFFDIHIAVDEHHVEELFRAINFIDNDKLKSLEFGVRLGRRGMSVILDESLGIFDFKNIYNKGI